MSEVRRCQYTKEDGEQCGSPAQRGKLFCYFHNVWNEAESRRALEEQQSPFPMGIPDLENPNAIQGALTELMRLMLADRISDRKAGLLLYALQFAATNLKNTWSEDAPEDLPQQPWPSQTE